MLRACPICKLPVTFGGGITIENFFEDFSEYLVNLEKSQEGHMNVNYNFLVKLYSELNADQKLKFNKSLQISGSGISKAV